MLQNNVFIQFLKTEKSELYYCRYGISIADLHFDLHKIPLEDNLYDVIFCNHVLEHVEDDHQCMKELYRVMKAGGWGIFQVPIDYNNKVTYEDSSITDPKEEKFTFGKKDHVNCMA